MPTKYCAAAGCGEKIVYSALTPPVKCPSCGHAFAKAFQSTLAQASTVYAVASQVTPLPSPELTDQEEETIKANSYEVQANARLLRSQIDPDDFLVTHQKEEPLKVRDAITIVNTPPPARRAAPKARATRRGKK